MWFRLIWRYFYHCVSSCSELQHSAPWVGVDCLLIRASSSSDTLDKANLTSIPVQTLFEQEVNLLDFLQLEKTSLNLKKNQISARKIKPAVILLWTVKIPRPEPKLKTFWARSFCVWARAISSFLSSKKHKRSLENFTQSFWRRK